jgi:hypothetical protein
MPYKTNLELFGPLAPAYLTDGPKPQTALDGHVPVSVLEHLRSAGMVKRKMLRHGSMATAWWYMADDDRRLFQVLQCRDSPAATILTSLMECKQTGLCPVTL